MSDQEIAQLEGEIADPLGKTFEGPWNSHYTHNVAKQERYSQLIEARDSGAAAAPSPSAAVSRAGGAMRLAELEGLMQEDNGEYWHSEKLQAEYRNLIQGGLPFVEVPSGEADQAGETQERVNTAFQGIDTADLDASFMGMSDDAQGWATRVLQDPSQREACIEQMPAETLEELIAFVKGMPDEEVAALERALFLT